jgi:hypothetical protein
MKKVTAVTLLFLAALVAGLFGCDDDSDSGQGMRDCGSTWTVITPADGNDFVETTTNFVLQRNVDLDDSPDLNDEITLHYGNGQSVSFSSDNSEMTIAGDTVTIDPSSLTALSTTRTYSRIIIRSFEAQGAPDKASEACIIEDYSFTTKTGPE